MSDVKVSQTDIRVFISYAREDEKAAIRLYNDLKNSDLPIQPWIDKEDLLPGTNYDTKITNLIHTSTFFIPLFSSTSVQKRGYIQREFKRAINTLEEIPPDDIFVIPVRLDECEIPYYELKKYHYQDFFPNWYDGLEKIVAAIKLEIQKKKINLDSGTKIHKEQTKIETMKKPQTKPNLYVDSDYSPVPEEQSVKPVSTASTKIKIKSIFPKEGTKAGDMISIFGSNFGNKPDMIWFNNIPVDTRGYHVTTWLEKRIDIKIPESIPPGNYDIRVANDDKISKPYQYELAREIYSKIDLENYKKIENEKQHSILQTKTNYGTNPSKDIDALNQKGLDLYNQGEYQEAIKWYDKALEIDPNYVYALNNKGLALNFLYEYKEAIKYLKRALAIDPNYVRSLNNIGWALAALGKYKEAIKYLDKALAIDPNFVHAINNKGWALYGQCKYKEAIDYYDRVLRIDPNYTSALHYKKLALEHL